MIIFLNNNNFLPYIRLREKYNEAVSADQILIEAMSVSSYNSILNEVNSRYVNLKFVDNNKFIFFSNYNSTKSKEFESHKQISATIHWPNIKCQIRMKANIKKTSSTYNEKYFRKRSHEKNALAISSNQSARIDSYDDVLQKYNHIRQKEDLSVCPNYWGGFAFKPYYFEFWEGNESRINKRVVYELKNNLWDEYFLEP